MQMGPRKIKRFCFYGLDILRNILKSMKNPWVKIDPMAASSLLKILNGSDRIYKAHMK